MIPSISMHRFEFIQRFAIGEILDMGSHTGDGWLTPQPLGIHNDYKKSKIIFADCDNHKIIFNKDIKILQCFAENVPLPDKSVDTVCLGDIIEHVNDPDIVIIEAKRLSRNRILITVPNEYEWPKELNPFYKKEDYTRLHIDEFQRNNPVCINDDDFPHLYHRRWYNHETFEKFIKKHSIGMNYILFNLKYSGSFVNFAAMMWWK